MNRKLLVSVKSRRESKRCRDLKHSRGGNFTLSVKRLRTDACGSGLCRLSRCPLPGGAALPSEARLHPVLRGTPAETLHPAPAPRGRSCSHTPPGACCPDPGAPSRPGTLCPAGRPSPPADRGAGAGPVGRARNGPDAAPHPCRRCQSQVEFPTPTGVRKLLGGCVWDPHRLEFVVRIRREMNGLLPPL